MSFDFSALSAVFKPYQEKISATLKPAATMSLVPQQELSLWQSKVGGQPYLPLETAYPKDSEGQPLALLAQINLAEMPALPDFPAQGILQFYIAADDLYGMNFDDQQAQSGFRVLYFENVTEDFQQLKQNFSDIQFNDEYLLPLPLTQQYAVKFLLEQQAISSSDFAFGRKILAAEQLHEFESQYEGDDFYDEFFEPYAELFPGTGHRLGGYPFFTQSDPREYNHKIQDYILLFQLDSDSEDGKDIMWGDAGVGNFFIHPDDLRKRDFSKVVYNWDCS